MNCRKSLNRNRWDSFSLSLNSDWDCSRFILLRIIALLETIRAFKIINAKLIVKVDQYRQRKWVKWLNFTRAIGLSIFGAALLNKDRDSLANHALSKTNSRAVPLNSP